MLNEPDFEARFAGGASPRPSRTELRRSPLSAICWSIASCVACSSAGLLFERYLQLADILMIYLIGVVAIASYFSVAESIASAVGHAVVFNYIFPPPRFAFAVPDLKSAIICAAMVLVAAALASSQQRIRAQERSARSQAHLASALYVLSRELGTATSFDQVASVTSRNVERMLGGRALVVAAENDAMPAVPADLGDAQRDAMRRAWTSRERAVLAAHGGHLTVCVPMLATRRPVGLLVVQCARPSSLREAETTLLLEHCAQQAATAAERIAFEQEALRAQVAVEAERTRSLLLSAVSHDVRTPLATIKAAGETLTLPRGAALSPAKMEEFGRVIVNECDRLMRLVNNVLNLTRLESGSVPLERQDVAVEELLSEMLRRFTVESTGRKIVTHLPAELPFVSVDATLMEQALVNVLDNAVKYTPAPSPIDITAARDGDMVVVSVADEGPGFRGEEPTRLLEKFVRGAAGAKAEGGLGLGLSIARAIADAHGGSIRLSNRLDRAGAVVELRLPVGRAFLEEEADDAK